MESPETMLALLDLAGRWLALSWTVLSAILTAQAWGR